MRAAATETLEVYGGEIFSFLLSRLRTVSDAQEAFSMFTEDLWNGLPAFGWRCSMRTWAYTLARHAAARYATAPRLRAAKAAEPELAALIEKARSSTNLYQQTDVKDRFRALRAQLDDEGQLLLVLRVDRGMSWRDLALTMSGDVELDEPAIARESARLRKAFERVKSELKAMAEREGLIKSEK